MIYLDIQKVLSDKGIENPHLALRQMGFNVHTTSRLLRNEPSSINYGHLEILCLSLNCLPNDLLSWKPSELSKKYTHHQLDQLAPVEKDNLATKIQKLPVDKLQQIRKFVDDLSKEDENTTT